MAMPTSWGPLYSANISINILLELSLWGHQWRVAAWFKDLYPQKNIMSSKLASSTNVLNSVELVGDFTWSYKKNTQLVQSSNIQLDIPMDIKIQMPWTTWQRLEVFKARKLDGMESDLQAPPTLVLQCERSYGWMDIKASKKGIKKNWSSVHLLFLQDDMFQKGSSTIVTIVLRMTYSLI